MRNLSNSALTIVLLAGTVFIGCDDATAPVITKAEIVPNPNNTLSATIEIETDVPTTLAIEVHSQGADSWQIPIADNLATTHQISLLGLRATTEYSLSVTATEAGLDSVTDESLTFTSGALPADFPSMEVAIPLPAQVSPGITMFALMRIGPDADLDPGNFGDWGLIVGVDNEGQVVWYHATDHGIADDFRRLSNGNLGYIRDHKRFIEIDPMGELVGEITAEELGIDSFHHELLELPSGDFLTLSTDLRTIDGYQDENGDPASFAVVGDVIVEFNRDRQVLNEVNLFDILDPLRIGSPDFHFPFWDTHYGTQGTKDWTHANAVVVDPSDNSYILSSRHQDLLLKIDRESSDLLWTLGPEGDLAMVGDGEMPFHQHAPEVQENGNLIVYDNGNGRTTLAENEPPYSRVVEFAIDDEKQEVTQVWEYRGDPEFFTPNVGDADRMSNGNVMVVNGSLTSDPTQPFGNTLYARILEVTYGPDSTEVIEITVRDDAPADQRFGYFMYRAERVDSLYPPIN